MWSREIRKGAYQRALDRVTCKYTSAIPLNSNIYCYDRSMETTINSIDELLLIYKIYYQKSQKWKHFWHAPLIRSPRNIPLTARERRREREATQRSTLLFFHFVCYIKPSSSVFKLIRPAPPTPSLLNLNPSRRHLRSHHLIPPLARTSLSPSLPPTWLPPSSLLSPLSSRPARVWHQTPIRSLNLEPLHLNFLPDHKTLGSSSPKLLLTQQFADPFLRAQLFGNE
jgi:hypothetical protein